MILSIRNIEKIIFLETSQTVHFPPLYIYRFISEMFKDHLIEIETIKLIHI